jgi:hypothetical protein
MRIDRNVLRELCSATARLLENVAAVASPGGRGNLLVAAGQNRELEKGRPLARLVRAGARHVRRTVFPPTQTMLCSAS